MRSVNKVILIGNLTRDPEIRQTTNGQKVVTFGIATNRVWVTKDGRKQDLVEYHDLVAWAKLADMCESYLRKGKLIYVEGYLKTRNWTTPEGVKRFRTEIVVQDLIILDKKNSEEQGEYIPEGDEISNGNSVQEEKKVESVQNMPSEQAESIPSKNDSQSQKIDIDSDLGL